MLLPSASSKSDLAKALKDAYSEGIDFNTDQKTHTFIPAFCSEYKAFFDKIQYEVSYDKKNRNYVELKLDNSKSPSNNGDEEIFSVIKKYRGVYDDRLFDGNIKFFLNKVKAGLRKINIFSRSQTICKIFNNLNHYPNIISLLLRPLDSGTNRIILLYRSNQLKELRRDFKANVNAHIELIKQAGSNPILREELAEQRNRLDTELISIITEKKSIASDYSKYLLEVTKYVISNIALIVFYSPFKSLIDLAFIVGKIPGLIELIDLVLVGVNSKQLIENRKIYDVWERVFLLKVENKSDVNFLTPAGKADLEIEFPKINENNMTWEELAKYFEENKTSIENIVNKEFFSNSSVKKANALKNRKIIQLVSNPKKIEGIIKRHFATITKNKCSEHQLTLRFDIQSRYSLLSEYVDQQMELEKGVKSSLSYMIKNKLKLEKVFLDFKLMQARFSFWYSVMAFTSSLVGAGVGIFLGPTGAVLGLAVGLYVASIVRSLAFWLASYKMGSKYRAHSSGFLNLKIMFRQVKYEIGNYWLNVKEKKLQEKNPNFLQIYKTRKKNIEGISDREIREFKRRKKVVENRLAKLELLKSQRRENEWADFANYANLPKEHLKNLNENLGILNFDLLDAQMLDILKVELGFDFRKLKKELTSSSKLVRDRALHTLFSDLQTFFTLNEEGYISFMKHQNLRKEIGNLP